MSATCFTHDKSVTCLKAIIIIQSSNYFESYFLGCIECMRCRLLLPMIAVSVCRAAQLGFTVQKTAERINILFGINTLGNQRNIVLNGGRDFPQREEGELGRILPIVDRWPKK